MPLQTRKLSLYLAAMFAYALMNACAGGAGNDSVATSLFESSSYNSSKVVDIVKSAAADTSNAMWQRPLDTLLHTEDVAALYKCNNGALFWLKGNGLSKKGEAVLQQLDTVFRHGLDPELFGAKSLRSLAKQVKDDNSAAQLEFAMSIAYTRLVRSMVHGAYAADAFREEWYSAADSFDIAKRAYSLFTNDSIKYLCAALQPRQIEYASLLAKLASLRKIDASGGWPKFSISSDSASKATTENYVPQLRKRLFAEIGMPADTSSSTLDTTLLTAIHRFQYLHNLKSTGIVDTSTLRRLKYTAKDKILTVRTNLERMRWMQNNYTAPHVYVNIPYMELEYREQDTTSFKMRVVVGRVSRPTPTLDALMSNIVFNPPWSVPPTIMKEEIVPGVAKKGGSYLARRGLKAYLGGRLVDASRITATNYKMFTISQQPGLNSSLGAVKFNLPNRHAIYLHDTPHREDFVKNYRAYSSGCIRVHHPREFAEFLLQDSNYSKPKIDSLVRNKQTREVQLKQKLPVHIVYLTNAIDSAGNLLFLRDIYAQDKLLNNVWH
jgi:L,D-transpeptidase YcbB